MLRVSIRSPVSNVKALIKVFVADHENILLMPHWGMLTAAHGTRLRSMRCDWARGSTIPGWHGLQETMCTAGDKEGE
jgi:hypothetical protein